MDEQIQYEYEYEYEYEIVDSKIAKSDSFDEIVYNIKKNNDWFIIVEDNSNVKHLFIKNNFKKEIKNGLISGQFNSESQIQKNFRDTDGFWTKENTKVKEFIREYKGLKVLYKPIWNHAMIGLEWGIYIGIILKLLDTALLFGYDNPIIGLLFLAAIGVVFVPKIGIMTMAIALIVLNSYTEIDIHLVMIISALFGAIFVGLPGMFLGGLIGWIRKRFSPQAHDASVEPSSVLIISVVLPIIGTIVIFFLFFAYILPWISEYE